MLSLISVFTIVGWRITDVIGVSEQAWGGQSSKSVELATLRGTVYDCNLQPLTNGETQLYAAAKPSGYSLTQLKGKVLPEVFDYVMERMAQGKSVAVKIDSPVVESDDIKQIPVPVRYYENSLACHIIGYTDGAGQGVSGIEKAFDSLLAEYTSTVAVRFEADAKGRTMLGGEIEVEGNVIPQSGVVLTIDKDIQRIAENALDTSGTERAAVVVIEIENGAIRACVSRPAFNQNDISVSLNNENSPLINRAFLPFSVGSVFKPVVAASALENGVENFEYNCTGSVTLNGVTFNCHKKDGHGLIDMRGAVANSCNTYFIALGNLTGGDNIIETAEKFGFGNEISFAQGMKSSSGNLPYKDELDSKAAVANLSFGQGSLTATPLQICSAFATIAGGGVKIQPYLIEGYVDDGEFTRVKNYGERRQVVSASTAKLLQEFLKAVVTEGSGKRAQSSFVTVAGKTATAQTGKTENGEEIYNAWFAGWFPADEPEYAVAILKEDGGEGAVSCAPVFREIAENIAKTRVYNSEK